MKYSLITCLSALFFVLGANTVLAEDIPVPPDVAKAPADATCTDSGLCSKVLKAGTGTEHPAAWDKVTVNYSGWTTDGEMFDSSVKRGQPATFPLNHVIPGWTEGLQLMVKGEKRRFWIPEKLAYGGQSGKPAGMLVFDVELLSFERQPEPPPPPKTPEDVAAPPADAVKMASGISTKVLKAGTGKIHPDENSKVTFDYSAWTTDGKMFDSSIVRGKPVSVPMRSIVPGWAEGLSLMVQGEKRRLWVPEELAFKGRPGAPQGMIVIDAELKKIEEMPEPPPVPKDVAAAPADAKKTESGLAYKVLKEGTGKEHPTATSTVTVDYSGWTTDGKMFDSSIPRGEPATFPLNRVIPGWTEGVQLMTRGEKVRFWIPEDLAYGGRAGAPAGMLVFDVELIDFK